MKFIDNAEENRPNRPKHRISQTDQFERNSALFQIIDGRIFDGNFEKR